MRHVLMLSAALAMLSIAAAPASAQTLDKNGRCHGKDGKFAKAEVCKAGGSMTGPEAYKFDAKGNCHDAKGKMAKKELCKKP